MFLPCRACHFVEAIIERISNFSLKELCRVEKDDERHGHNKNAITLLSNSSELTITLLH